MPGCKVFTVQGTVPRDAAFTQTLCADERQRLEQLCRYITRPALANERVQCNAAGQVVLKLKTAWHDGTTHIVMSPLEFMQRLVARATEGRPQAPVPRPRLHLIRFHGVLALYFPISAKLRALVVPAGPEEATGRVGAHRDRVRLRARPAGAQQLGPAAQAGLRDRYGALPELRW